MCEYCSENPKPIVDDPHLRVLVRRTNQDIKLIMQLREKNKEFTIDIASCPKCHDDHFKGTSDMFKTTKAKKKENIVTSFLRIIK